MGVCAGYRIMFLLSNALKADKNTTTTIPIAASQSSPFTSSAVPWESRSPPTESRKLTHSLLIVFLMAYTILTPTRG